MLQGNASASMHVPPYVLLSQPVNTVVGLNTVGLRRAPYLSEEDRRQVKEAFRITYRSGLPVGKALETMDQCADWGDAATKFRDFVRRVLAANKPYRRGLCSARLRAHERGQ